MNVEHKSYTTSNTTDTLPAYVSRHLTTIAQAEGLTDYTVETAAGCKHGEGFMSNMLAISLVSNLGDGKRLPLVCKLQPPPAATSDAVDSALAFEREIDMYSTVLPAMAELQRHHGLTEETGFFAYPKCYLAERGANNESIIVLENLLLAGYHKWDKFVPLAYENVAALVRQLGRYNGLSFVLRDQRPDVFGQLVGLQNVYMTYMRGNPVMQCIFKTMLKQAERLLEAPADRELMRSFRENDVWLDRLGMHTSGYEANRFGVMGHGDCHVNNMMFTKEGKIVIYDWQVSSIQSPAFDLGHFVLLSTNASFRGAHLEDLLRIYHGELTDIITRCGSNAEALFSFDDFMGEMRSFGSNGLMSLAPMGLSMMITPPDGMRTMSELADSLAAGADPTDITLAPIRPDTELEFKTRLRDVIADCRRYLGCRI